MITTQTEHTRFYTGETVSYTNASTAWLFEQTIVGESDDMRAFAAAGLMRAVLDIPPHTRGDQYCEVIAWATELLCKARGGGTEVLTLNPGVELLPAVTATLDSVTVTATRANRPERMAEMIGGYGDENSAALVIGIGHGGIIAAVDTFLAIPDEDKMFYPVRFSRYKHSDKAPVLSECEINALKEVAQEKKVIVIEEDRGLTYSSTIREAVKYFAKLFRTNVYGATPALGRHPARFWPQLIDASGHILYER